MTVSIQSAHQLARSQGLTHEQAITATAIAIAESGLNENAVGDVALQNATWGPSIGLWQIRSVKADRGSGRPRDATRLTNPAFNAAAMASISSTGRSFSAWSTYTNGAYKTHLAKVRAAVGSSSPLEAPVSHHGAPAGSGGGSSASPVGDWDPLPGGSGAPGYGDDLLGWATGGATKGIEDSILKALVWTTVAGLAVTLIAIGANRTVMSGAS